MTSQNALAREHSRREPYATLLGATVILAIALFFSQGLPYIAAKIPGTPTVAAGTIVDIGSGVTYCTEAGWSVDLAKTKPKDTSTLVRNASVFTLTTFEWTATPAELVTRTKNLFEGIAHLHTYSDETPFQTEAGLTGMTYTIQGEKLEGRVWVIALADGKHGIAARLRGHPGHLNEDLRDARKMVESLKVKEAIQ